MKPLENIDPTPSFLSQNDDDIVNNSPPSLLLSQLNTSQQQRLPIYMRAELELQRKQIKIE